MRFRFFLIPLVVSLLVFAVPQTALLVAQEDLEAKIIGIEKKLWEAWKNHDAVPFDQHVSDDYINISQDGIAIGKSALLKSISSGSCDVKSLSYADWKVHQFSSDTVIVTCKVLHDAVCDGNKIAPEVYASTVYVKKGSAWLNVCHHNIPAAK